MIRHQPTVTLEAAGNNAYAGLEYRLTATPEPLLARTCGECETRP